MSYIIAKLIIAFYALIAFIAIDYIYKEYQLDKSTKDEFSSIDAIHNGFHFSSESSEKIYDERPFDEEKNIYNVMILGRTFAGNWFTLSYVLDKKYQRTSNKTIKSISDLEAKNVLAKDIQTYVRYFGPPDEA